MNFDECDANLVEDDVQTRCGPNERKVVEGSAE